MRHDNIIAGQWRKTTTPRVAVIRWKKASSDFDYWSRCHLDDDLRAAGATIFPDYDQWADRESWFVLWPTSNTAKFWERYRAHVDYRVMCGPS